MNGNTKNITKIDELIVDGKIPDKCPEQSPVTSDQCNFEGSCGYNEHCCCDDESQCQHTEIIRCDGAKWGPKIMMDIKCPPCDHQGKVIKFFIGKLLSIDSAEKELLNLILISLKKYE